MKLTYRGVQYSEKKPLLLSPSLETVDQEIIYRGNSRLGRINPNFPWLGYVKQLFPRSESRPIVDPIKFWYNHKREFIEECWHLDNREKIALTWNLTIRIERAKALKSQQKTKLKYRGVTYYK
ncbi:MAG: DUF4278 domain-containing protein [Cyanobacteria bacterium J06643_13]